MPPDVQKKLRPFLVHFLPRLQEAGFKTKIYPLPCEGVRVECRLGNDRQFIIAHEFIWRRCGHPFQANFVWRQTYGPAAWHRMWSNGFREIPPAVTKVHKHFAWYLSDLIRSQGRNRHVVLEEMQAWIFNRRELAMLAEISEDTAKAKRAHNAATRMPAG